MSVRSEMEWSIAGLIFRRLGGLVRFLHHPLVEVLAHLPAHLLHKPRHALGITFVEIAQAARVGQRLEAGLLRFGSGDAGHGAGQTVTPPVLGARRLGVFDAPDEERGAPAAGAPMVFLKSAKQTPR